MLMKSIKGHLLKKNKASRLSAQATLEYVLLLVMVAIAALSLNQIFRDRLLTLMRDGAGRLIFDQFFNPAKMHKYRFKVPRNN
jgi:hypothetical protein